MKTEAIIYMFEDEERLTVKCSFIDNTKSIVSENIWTFDIVDERLLLSIVNQTIINHGGLKKIYLILPVNESEGGIISGDRVAISRDFRNRLIDSSVEIIIKNNLNTAAEAYNDTAVTISFPLEGSPAAGIVTDSYIGELKNLMPDINLRQIGSMPGRKQREIISRILKEVNDLFSADRIVLYSSYADSKLLEGISFDLKTPIYFKNLKDDIESWIYNLPGTEELPVRNVIHV